MGFEIRKSADGWELEAPFSEPPVIEVSDDGTSLRLGDEIISIPAEIQGVEPAISFSRKKGRVRITWSSARGEPLEVPVAAPQSPKIVDLAYPSGPVPLSEPLQWAPPTKYDVDYSRFAEIKTTAKRAPPLAPASKLLYFEKKSPARQLADAEALVRAASSAEEAARAVDAVDAVLRSKLPDQDAGRALAVEARLQLAELDPARAAETLGDA